MEGKSHEPSVDANDRESRIQARRNRIETRNASKDDEARKKEQLVGESKHMSRGQQQIADSLNQLDRRKLAGIQNVTSVRVHADDTENKRRIEEEERRHKRVEKLQQEAIASGAKNAAVEMRWSDLFEFSMPQELHRELEAQNRSCAEILASKDGLIREFQNQLKAKDEEYVTALKVQADEVEKLIGRMSQQYREMQDEYEMELEQMEDAFLKERDELIANNKLEIDSLFEKRREMEMVYMEAKQARDEQYLKEIENLHVKDAEDYSELKIKLETNIQTLEQQLEEMRATYQLNTEKLEYNYRVLTERDMENSATLSQQKRKLARLKDALSTLISKYNQTDARDRNQNQELTEEYRRLTKQYKDLQKKYAHFETSDRNKYDEVWVMHEEEALEKIEKLLNADKIIHEQQLGLVWKRPAQSIRDWSQIGTMKKKKQEQLSGAGARTSDDRGDGDSDSNHDERNGDAFGEIDVPVVRKISSSKLKYMLKLLATEAGFLVNGNFQQALENLPDDEAELVKADMIMRALGVDNEDDMERLMGFFFQDPRAEVPMEYGSNSGSSNNLNGTPQQVPTSKWGLMIGPEDAIRVIKQFVEEMNEQKQVVPLTRMLRRASNSHGDDDKHKAYGGSKENGSSSSSGSSSAGTNAATLKARAQREEREYWDAMVNVIPLRTRRVMDALEKGLTMYHHALLRRKELVDGVAALKQQNAELKTLYLGAAINEDLIVPPTQMQLYQ
ncbi:Dynein regulatory complex protein 1, partial [Globisporangium splendens]